MCSVGLGGRYQSNGAWLPSIQITDANHSFSHVRLTKGFHTNVAAQIQQGMIVWRVSYKAPRRWGSTLQHITLWQCQTLQRGFEAACPH